MQAFVKFCGNGETLLTDTNQTDVARVGGDAGRPTPVLMRHISFPVSAVRPRSLPTCPKNDRQHLHVRYRAAEIGSSSSWVTRRAVAT